MLRTRVFRIWGTEWQSVSITTCHVSRVWSVTRVMWARDQETEREKTSWTRMGCSCLAGGAGIDELMRMPCTALGEMSRHYVTHIHCQVWSACPDPSPGMSGQFLITSHMTDCVRLSALELNIQIPFLILMSPHTRNIWGTVKETVQKYTNDFLWNICINDFFVDNWDDVCDEICRSNIIQRDNQKFARKLNKDLVKLAKERAVLVSKNWTLTALQTFLLCSRLKMMTIYGLREQEEKWYQPSSVNG